MRKTDLPIVLLFFAALPLGCTQSPSSPPTGGGGSGGSTHASGGSGGGNAGGSNPQGGNGSGGSATGGKGGVATGGASGDGSGGPGNGGASDGSGGTVVGGASGGNPGGAGGGNGGSSGTTDDGGAGAGSSDTGPAPSCTDKTTNGDETDSDCGGGTCPKCGAGKTCKADSDCKGGSCASGKCADPFAATGTISNVNSSNIWRITMGTMTLEADQSATGMVSAFSLDGTNFLVINSASNGSVFWTAPQSDWNWPPPDEMYSSAYTPSSKDNVLTMTSPTGKDGLTFTKRFWGNVDHQAVTLEYTVKNGTAAEIKKAPWEITRVYPGGLTFFPNAEDPVVLPGTSNSFLAVPFTTGAGAAWFKYQKAAFTQDIKGGADGLEGWAAHINCGTGLEQTCATGTKSLILIKEWDDTTSQAPGEKEVEIYANAGHNYVEFEQQGNYQPIPAGGTMVWTMHWMLRALPSDVAPTPGSADLVKWVRSQLL